jgi:hypothetical protein
MVLALIGSFLVLFAASVDAGQAGRDPEPNRSTFASALTPGTAVRIRSTILPARIQSVVVGIDDSVVTVASEGGPQLKIPMSSITAMDVRVGRRRHALWGTAAGAALGLLSGFAAPIDSSNCLTLFDPASTGTEYCSRGEAVVYETLGSALVGAGIGWLIKSDRWTSMNIGVRPSITAEGRGATVGVSFRF